jgi:resuscitation-promoting factor RpfA
MDVPIPSAAATPWEDAPEHAALQTAPAAEPAPAQASARPGEIIEVHARPAALWQRITAFIVDGTLICGVLALYVGTAAALITPRGVTATQLTGIDGVMARVHQLNAVLAPCVALALVLGLAYTAVFALLWNGRTPGRRLLGIRLVDRTGLAPAPGRAIARAALAVLSFVPFLAGFWLALFDRRGQTLHDKLTQTFVVRPG